MASEDRPESIQKTLLDDETRSPSGHVDPIQLRSEVATADISDHSTQASKAEEPGVASASDPTQEEVRRPRKRRETAKRISKSDNGGSDDAGVAPPAVSQAPRAKRTVPEKKLYQDEIYGTKELSPLAVAIIDTPEFQRLGQIFQLGFTYQAFRGANHRRFDHSVGTFFRVRTLLRRIVQNHARLFSSDEDEFRHPGRWLSPLLYIPAPGTRQEDQIPKSSMGRWRGMVEIVSGAALLHDLGHVPAGHTLEDEFNIIGKHDGLGGGRFFQMFYGPRDAKETVERPSGQPAIESFFSRIDEGSLPRPEAWQRAPLPWVFEDGVYDRFLERNPNEPTSGLSNSHIRDLIYLILSFKDASIVDEHQNVYTTFEGIIEKDLDKAKHTLDAVGDDSVLRQHALKKLRRIEFIEALYRYYSRSVDLDDESKPVYCPFMSDVVGNTICADLLDYLVRDGKRLKLDIRDNPRLERYLVIRPDQSLVLATPHTATEAERPPNLRLTIYAVHATPGKFPRRDTVSDLLDLMRERYRFAEIVYYHPKKAAFSAMLAKAMELLRQELPAGECPQDDEHIYPAPWTGAQTTKPRHMAHFGDEGLVQFLADKTDRIPRIKDLCHGITYRSEYRLLYTVDYDTAITTGGATKFTHDLKPQDGGGGLREQRENELAELLYRGGHWQPEDAPPVLIYCPSPKMQAKEVEARVELEVGKSMSLNRHESLRDELRMMNEKYQRLWRLYLFVHPRLIVTLDEFQQASLVDAFCDLYGISVNLRGKGCRGVYRPLAERVDRYYRDWIDRLKLGAWPESVRQFVKQAAADARFWSDRLGAGLAGHPVAASEYYDGFYHLAQIAAADAADGRAREEWPRALQSFNGRQWYCSADDRTTERARTLARDEFKTLVDASNRDMLAADNPLEPEDWQQFCGRVHLLIRGIRR
jgi:HD superfamily phosphohydrolase